MTTKRASAATCTVCNCKGNVLVHNLNGLNRMHTKIAAAQTDACPKCNGAASPELLAIWGHCMSCQKASQASKYGF